MHHRRQLVSAAVLAVFVAFAFGSELPEDTGRVASTPPTTVDEPNAPTAAAAVTDTRLQCSTWQGTGSPASSIEALFNPKTLESVGRKMDFNVECYDVEDYGDSKDLDCDFWNREWGFDVEVEWYRSTDDAEWAVEDPWPGYATRRQGRWVLSVEADNGACAQQLLDIMVPRGEHVKNFTEARIVSQIDAMGWKLSEGGCSVEKYDGTKSFDCSSELGEELTASFSLSYELDATSALEEERELDSGQAYLHQAHGYASASVGDSASAEKMLQLLLR